MIRLIFWIAGLVVLCAMYGWALATGVGNLIGMQGFAAGLGTTLTGVAYFWLILEIVAPALVFGAIILYRMRDGKKNLLLLLLLGLTMLSIMHIQIMHYVPRTSFFNLLPGQGH